MARLTSLKNGEVQQLFSEHTNRETRERIKRVIAQYYTGLLKMHSWTCRRGRDRGPCSNCWRPGG